MTSVREECFSAPAFFINPHPPKSTPLLTPEWFGLQKKKTGTDFAVVTVHVNGIFRGAQNSLSYVSESHVGVPVPLYTVS